MSAATVTGSALSDFQVRRYGSGMVDYTFTFPARGATAYSITYSFLAAPGDRFSDSEPYALPAVQVLKLVNRRGTNVPQDKAPQYVRDAIAATLHEVAQAEHNRHGIAPLPRSLREAWAAHGAWGWSGSELRKAEGLLRQIERPGVRREQAREIAAWMVRDWMERAEHEEVLEEVRDAMAATHAAELDELESAHANDSGRLNDAADVVVGETQSFLDALRHPQGLEFAAGNTTTEKVLDLTRDLEAALTAYELKETAA